MALLDCVRPRCPRCDKRGFRIQNNGVLSAKTGFLWARCPHCRALLKIEANLENPKEQDTRDESWLDVPPDEWVRVIVHRDWAR